MPGARRTFTLVVATVPLAMTSHAVRAESGPPDVGDALAATVETVDDLPTDLVPPPAEVVSIDGIGAIALEGGGVVIVPQDAAEGVGVQTPAGVDVSIGLPGSSSAEGLVRDGLTVFEDAFPHATIAVQPLDGGGVQSLAILDGPDAPTEYRYPIESDRVAMLVRSADGSIEMLDSEGASVGHVSAPWAVDASGRAIPTSYRIEGTTIVQTVEHLTSEVAYPVVADPCFWGWKCAKQVVKGAVGGAIAGAVGGCVLGALSTAWGGGFGCVGGAAGGAASGGAAGAVAGWWGA